MLSELCRLDEAPQQGNKGDRGSQLKVRSIDQSIKIGINCDDEKYIEMHLS